MSVEKRKKARKIVEGDRAAIIAPSRFSADLWVVSLDGHCCDVLCTDEADAEKSARNLLRDPECPMWLKAEAVAA